MTEPTHPDHVNPSDEEYLTDHNYDGIQEYDNPLPGWWKALFWASIGFSFLYWGWFHMGPGSTVEERYEASVAAADERAAARRAEQFAGMELRPDRETMIALINNDDAMQKQEGLWVAKCAVCHLADGRGMVGPNMLDDRYLNVQSLEDFPRIVRNGIIEKGMTPFAGQLSDEEIVLVAAYAAWLRGKSPDASLAGAPPPKEAQGEELPPWPTAPAE